MNAGDVSEGFDRPENVLVDNSTLVTSMVELYFTIIHKKCATN